MATTEPLTEQEQQALEQMRQAQKQGSTLKELAARLGLEVGHLYEIRRRLVRKGAFGPLPRRKPRKPRTTGAFVPVRVVPAAPTPGALRSHAG
jgi:transposase